MKNSAKERFNKYSHGVANLTADEFNELMILTSGNAESTRKAFASLKECPLPKELKGVPIKFDPTKSPVREWIEEALEKLKRTRSRP